MKADSLRRSFQPNQINFFLDPNYKQDNITKFCLGYNQSKNYLRKFAGQKLVAWSLDSLRLYEDEEPDRVVLPSEETITGDRFMY